MLGFTHYWGLSRRGKWVVKRRTASDRFGRALRRIADWCRQHRHREVREQWQGLSQKLRGHFGYFGITGNYEALERMREAVKAAWRKWLDRRSNSSRMTWPKMEVLLSRYPLPRARIVHPACYA